MDPITRLNTALEGRYRVESELGEGGMATVYLADDLKHERKVALKVLKPELAAVVGADRFLAEIKTTANLQHPHILPLFDSGEADSFLFYVMPYIEGETLRDRLERERQLPVDEAVRIATDVAEALHSAHEHGVIHRDIKPANILLSGGRPLVADFGIALAISTAGGGRLTETGLSMGTPYYMSPEQASADRDPSAASDVYSLGCVLYEMLVGEPPYVGSSAQAVLARILMGDAPAATATRASIPANVDAAVRKALEKLPADRFVDADALVKALGDPGFRYGEAMGAAGTPRSRWNRLTVSLAGTVLVLAALATWGWLRPGASPADHGSEPAFRMDLAGFRLTSPIGGGERLAISADGTRIVLASEVDGRTKLYTRTADDVAFEEIPGTEDASQPTLSPDGEWVAFSAPGNEVSRMAVAGGPVLSVGPGGSPHWGLDGSIVFSQAGVGIYRVASPGDEPTLVWADSVNNLPRPHVLPDGEAIVFQGAGEFETRSLMLVEIASGEVSDLGIPGSNPEYSPTGHLLFGHSSQALMAVPFDLETHQVTGAPLTVLPEVLVFNGGATQFVVSETGTAVVGLPGVGAQDRELVLVGVDGTETPLPLEGDFSHPRFSPGDGQQIVYESGRQIWIYDLVTGANDQLTSGSNYRSPWWSPDGQYVYYSGYTTGSGSSTSYDGLRRLADGSAEQEVLYVRPADDVPQALSPDGSRLLVEVATADRGRDLLLMTAGTEGPVFSDYLRGNWNEATAAISPDGAWVAYMSDQSGTAEIHVRSFPQADQSQMVSSGGGAQPVWAPDGSAIYYRYGAAVMRARVATGQALSVDAPELLFAAEWMADAIGSHDWDIHPDGGSFVAVKGPATDETEVGGVPVIPVQIIVNWFAELRRQTGS